MKHWFFRVIDAGKANDADLIAAIEASEAYLLEHASARKDLNGETKLERMASKIAGITEYRFAQIQDMNAIMEYLEERERVARTEKFKGYLEHYQRTLTDKAAREYAEATDVVQLIRSVKQRVGYVSGLMQGILKGLDAMNFQISNITKLKASGFDDAQLDFGRSTRD